MPRDWGAGRARLGASSENAPMQRAAESAGYQVESAVLWCAKKIEPDQE